MKPNRGSSSNFSEGPPLFGDAEGERRNGMRATPAVGLVYHVNLSSF